MILKLNIFKGRKRIIEVKNLKKSYGNVEAVKDLSFYVEKGKLFSFLGPNGAGKSTTINMICTFLKPDSGQVTVNGYLLGKEDNQIRNSIGAVFQDSLLDDMLTVEENLRCRGALYGLKGKELSKAVNNVMKQVGVFEYAKRPYGNLSGGQRRRCDIARALIHTPQILFLDEPTTGLDPQTRKVVWETILNLQKEHNMTIFLTTHYMEEAIESDYVIIIDDGKISAKGTPAYLKETYAKDTLKLNSSQIHKIVPILESCNCNYKKTSDFQLVVSLNQTLDSLSILEQCKQYLTSFEVTSGTMDEAFIAITGKEIRS